MDRESTYIQKQSKDGKTWFNIIKCLSVDAEKVMNLLMKQSPGCKFRVWTGRE